MNITKEPNGELTALVKIEVSEEDYIEKVNKVLKDYQRKASIRGFRPGKVPFGYVKKMYGSAVTADEVNKLISENLTTYLRDNEIKILAYPIPNNEKTGVINWSIQGSFDFYFDIGLAPEFELKFSDQITVEYFQIKASEEQVEDEVKRLTDQFGKLENVETSAENDWIDGELLQLDPDNNILDGGINTETYIYLPSIANVESRAVFTGLAVGDFVDFDFKTMFPENKAAARVLKLTEKEAAAIEGKFRFTVKAIIRRVPAEINQEFFKNVFPDKENLSEATFRMLVGSSIERQFSPESDKKFMHDAVGKIMELNHFNLPDEFLKRWLIETSNGKFTAGEVEKDFPKLVRNFKWDLVKQKIAKAHNIEVTEAEVRNYVKAYFMSRLSHQVEEDSEQMEKMIDRVLSKEADIEKIEADIFNQKLTAVMKQNLSVVVKEVSVEEFTAMYRAEHSHDHDHDHHHHDHDHDHQK